MIKNTNFFEKIKNPKNLKTSRILKCEKVYFPFWILRFQNLSEWPMVVEFDVTFRVDTFSYKKLFNPTSYAKVIAVLSRYKVFLKKTSKFMFIIFPTY
jgi:hypothetical protein